MDWSEETDDVHGENMVRLQEILELVQELDLV
jgi:hypothetical protein